MNLFRLTVAALLGGAGYPLMEIIFRGRTHKSMALAGALCLPMIRLCARLPLQRPLRALAAALQVTACEGVLGLLFNQDFKVWDYRKNRGNIAGQVCPKFFLLWYGLCWALTFRPRKKLLQKCC